MHWNFDFSLQQVPLRPQNIQAKGLLQISANDHVVFMWQIHRISLLGAKVGKIKVIGTSCLVTNDPALVFQ